MENQISFVKGDLMSDPAEVLINTVNCVGVMGKGIALLFKNAFPQNFAAYQKLCKSKGLKPGGIFNFTENTLIGKKVIINLATKDHWRNPSRYEWIENGLDNLAAVLRSTDLEYCKSVAMPAPGCGNGGLDWTEVKRIIIEKMHDVPQLLRVYEPF